MCVVVQKNFQFAELLFIWRYCFVIQEFIGIGVVMGRKLRIMLRKFFL